jgi:hypothetical protein
MNKITANGQSVSAQLPCTIEQFLVAQGLLSRSVSMVGAALAEIHRQR